MKGYFVIIGTLVVIVSVLITLNIFFQQSLQIEMAEQVNKQQLVLSRSVAENISAYVKLLREEVLAVTNVMKKIPMRTAKDFEWLSTKVLRDKVHVGSDLGILNSNGAIVFFEQKPSILGPQLHEIHKKGKLIRSGETDILATSSHIYIVSPLYDGNTLKQMVFLSVSIIDIANHFIGKIGSGSIGHASIIDKNGMLLYHYPSMPEMSRKNIYNADASCFKCHKSFELEKGIIEGREMEFGRHIAPLGEDKIIAFSLADIGQLSWIISVSAPFSEVTHATKESLKLYSYLIISILTTTIAVSALLIVFNKKRIQAEEIEKRRDEMEQYAIELERKVSDRTAELVSEKEKLNTIVSAIGSGIVLFDKTGTILWANQMMKEMSGSDVVGMTCEELCSECEISSAYSSVDEIETVIMSNLFGKEGRYFQVITAPITSEDAEDHGYIRLIQDVTELKKMEEQMSNSEKLASIGRLAAGIAHEIGNPLTSIFSFVQILREIEDDEFKKESLQTIYFHINRISEILKQLSGFTKMPMGEPKPCHINDTIDSSLTLIQFDKKAKTITIEKQLSPAIPEVSIDYNQLSQVFINLILNAFDAMPHGGTLFVRSFVEANAIVIQFEDTGTGIPKENLTKIFDPFYTTKEKGTGLGLAVSYSIIKKMGGTLIVQSETNKGTRFTITLPLQYIKLDL